MLAYDAPGSCGETFGSEAPTNESDPSGPGRDAKNPSYSGPVF